MRSVCAVLLSGVLASTVSCRSMPRGYETPPVVDVSWNDPVPAQEPASTLTELFQTALQNNRRIRGLQREVELAWADTRTIANIRDPEVRFGWQWGDGDGTGNSRQTATRESGAYETGHSTQWDEVVPRQLRSTEDSSETSRGTRRSSRTREEWETVSNYGWQLGLRLYPPNPWEYAAEVSEKEAEWQLAQSELREEQVQLMRDVLRAACELVFENKRLLMWKQLEEIMTRENTRAERSSLEGQTDLLRRTLNVQTRILRLQRQVHEMTGALELLCGCPVDPQRLAEHLEQFPKPTDATAMDGLVSQAAALRPDLAKTYWQACEYQARANLVSAESIPWFQHLEVSYRYSDRDQSQGYTGQSEADEFSTSYRDRNTDYASGHRRTETSSRSETSWSTEQESGSASSRRTDDEWRIETAVNIPIFDWFSRHGRDVRQTARHAWEDVDHAVADASAELTQRVRALKSAQQKLDDFNAVMLPQARKLREQHSILYKNGALSPADSMQLAEQVAEVAEEGLDIQETVFEALAALWIACGAPPLPAAEALPE